VSLKRFKQIQAYVREKGILPKEQGETCPLYLDGKCSVYAVRPPICVAFGHSEELQCSRGYNVNVNEAVVQRVALSGGPPERLLHELLDDGVRDLTKLESYPLLRALGAYAGLPVGSVYGGDA
jgi:Fe-S-cluster containining protein